MGLLRETYEVTYTKGFVTTTVNIRAKDLQAAKKKFGEKYGKCEDVRFRRK